MKKFLMSWFFPIVLLITNWIFFSLSGFSAQHNPLHPGHNLHNFHISAQTTKHAYAMGYAYVLESKINDSLYDDLKLIKNFNARGAPFRVYKEKTTGDLYMSYGWSDGPTLNPVAALHGINRTNDILYKIEEADFEILTGYAATIKDISGLTYQNITMDDIKSSFDIFWPLEDDRWLSYSVTANWKSKKVVREISYIVTNTLPWGTHQGIFIDDFGYDTMAKIYNANYGEEGTYSSWSEGQLDLVSSITEYARNTDLTGQQEPTFIFANIYNPNQASVLKTKSIWYANNTLRLDHYYYEQGGLGTQAPNGVVPGTNEPAYVDPKNPTGAYIPANRVALDDEYGYGRSSPFNRNYHFEQHLDACGNAGRYGAWFGWYGGDSVSLLYNDRQVYTNDLQLLRAIPNWDNIGELPLTNRIWENNEYQSSNSYASANVIYSINPINKEMYIVFRSLDETVVLPSGKKIKTACFVNELFEKTNEDALPAIDVSNLAIRIKHTHENKLFAGIRITFMEDSQLSSPSNVTVLN